MKKPLVSVLCQTFNHEKFICKALDGFLIQQTDFDFEICVHDDASTDSTVNIIKSYADKYPDHFRVIFQEVNQYSLGRSVLEINYQQSRGDYLALCEGDDYWIDPLKLQKQVNVMRKYPNCSLVGHGAIIKNTNNPFYSRLWLIDDKHSIIDTQTALLKHGYLFPLNAFMFKRKDFSLPQALRMIRVADLNRILYSAIIGEIHYIPDVMSVYQVGIKSSWTNTLHRDRTKVIEHLEEELRFLGQFDEYTHKSHHEEVKAFKDWVSYSLLRHKRDYLALAEPQFVDLRNQDMFSKFIYDLEMNFPKTYDVLFRLYFRYFG